jgi:hypothetical protein
MSIWKTKTLNLGAKLFNYMKFESASTRIIRLEREQIIILNGKNNKVFHIDTNSMSASQL